MTRAELWRRASRRAAALSWWLMFLSIPLSSYIINREEERTARALEDRAAILAHSEELERENQELRRRFVEADAEASSCVHDLEKCSERTWRP